jgi:hypothetical protein
LGITVILHRQLKRADAFLVLDKAIKIKKQQMQI